MYIFDEDVYDPYEIYDIARHENISEMYGDPPEEDDDFLRNFQDILDFSEYDDKILYVFKCGYKDWSVLLDKSYGENIPSETWTKTIIVEGSVNYTLETMLVNEYENPIDIAWYLSDNNDPEGKEFFGKKFNYKEFICGGNPR